MPSEERRAWIMVPAAVYLAIVLSALPGSTAKMIAHRKGRRRCCPPTTSRSRHPETTRCSSGSPRHPFTSPREAASATSPCRWRRRSARTSPVSAAPKLDVVRSVHQGARPRRSAHSGRETHAPPRHRLELPSREAGCTASSSTSRGGRVIITMPPRSRPRRQLSGGRVQHDLGPAIHSLVELVERVRRLIERQFVRHDAAGRGVAVDDQVA